MKTHTEDNNTRFEVISVVMYIVTLIIVFLLRDYHFSYYDITKFKVVPDLGVLGQISIPTIFAITMTIRSSWYDKHEIGIKVGRLVFTIAIAVVCISALAGNTSQVFGFLYMPFHGIFMSVVVIMSHEYNDVSTVLKHSAWFFELMLLWGVTYAIEYNVF